MARYIDANTLRDKIAFRIIRFGFKIAMKKKQNHDFFQYNLLGDTYTFKSCFHNLTKTVEKEGVE